MMFVLLIAAFISFASAKNVSLNGKSCGLSSSSRVEATTKRKLPKGRNKTMSNYAPTERQQKAERLPKKYKPLTTSNIAPNNP